MGWAQQPRSDLERAVKGDNETIGRGPSPGEEAGEAGDCFGAGIVGEMAGLEFAGAEAVLEGVGVAGLPAWGTKGRGDGRHPFET